MKLALFLLFSLVLAAEKQLCIMFFDFQPATEISEKGVKLGEGQNAEVNLHEERGKKFVLKTYKAMTNHLNSQIHNDYRAFRYLKSYEASFSFNLPEFSLVEASIMRLSYHPGRTVEEILNDKKVPNDVKKKVETAYKKMIDEIEKILHDFDYVEKTKDKLSAENDQLAMGTVHIIIKRDNVIVDPYTLTLTLIDPH